MSSIVSRTLASAPGGYATAAEVRAVSGLSSTNDIGDTDLNNLILDATLLFIKDVVVRVDGVELSTDSTGKVHRVPVPLIADLNGDAVVDEKDVRVRFIKEEDDGSIVTSATGTVTVESADFGVIRTVNALPSGYTAVGDYGVYRRLLELERAKRAVRYLAAHLAYLRVKAPGRITRADLVGIAGDSRGGRDEAIWVQRTKWLDEYRRALAGIGAAPLA